MRRLDQAGYSLVELLIAMSVFTFMLLIVSSAFVTIVHIQQSGLASRVAQQNNRNLMDEMMSTVRQNNSVVISNVGIHRLCVSTVTGTTKYLWIQIPTLPWGDIVRVDGPSDPGCSSVITGLPQQIINDSSVKVSQFTLGQTIPVQGSLGSVAITLSVVANSNLAALSPTSSPPYTSCKSGAGAQFCAVSTTTLSTILRTGDFQ